MDKHLHQYYVMVQKSAIKCSSIKIGWNVAITFPFIVCGPLEMVYSPAQNYVNLYVSRTHIFHYTVGSKKDKKSYAKRTK